MSAHAFVAGRFLTMDAWRPEPEVVVIEDGRIVAVAERALLAAHPDARIVELGGRTLLPGFIDDHNHLSIAALHPRWADLSRARTVDDLARALTAQAAREPEASWAPSASGQGGNQAGAQNPFVAGDQRRVEDARRGH